ncbi:MAG: ABC transporter ATP-binding protein [Verrucomicrobiota bacterium]|nr:ABC transporter ATP-binding protein [Verrucomicrobiota bacterium]
MLSPVGKLFLGPRYSHTKYLIALLFPLLLTAVFEGGSFACILLAFSALEGKESAPLFGNIQPHELLGFHLQGMDLFYFYILATVLFQMIRSGLNYLALIGTSALSLKIQTLAQQTICTQIFRFSFPFVSRYRVGDLIEYVKTPPSFFPYFFECANKILVSCAMSLGLLSLLLFISWKLTAITFFLFLLLTGAQKSLIRTISKYSKELTGHLVEFSHRIVQSLQGLRPIHIFCKQTYILKKTENILQQVNKTSKRLYLWSHSLPVLNETISILLVGVTLILGSYLLTNTQGTAVLPSLLTYIALTYRLANRLQIAMSAAGTISTHWGSILRLNDILDEQGKEYLVSAEKPSLRWNSSIDCQNVWLKYPGNDAWSLQNLSFSIPKGSSVALVGLSGAGKSSILDLILGLRAPSQGKILIDGESLTNYSETSWREQIGVVSQDSFLFHDTIEENIRFGTPQATQEEIHLAAQKAYAADFIARLPRGYNTLLGDVELSGGEKQRITLARAFLRNPSLLLLDEATSHLDAHSEEQILLALEHLRGKTTMIFVTHRLTTITRMDRIFVIDGGRQIEEGSHEELLQKGSRYAQLWHKQLAL